MTWRPLLLLCLLGTSSLGLSAPTGQDTSKKSQPDIAQTQVFRATTRLVTVDVIVHDASGQPIYNLQPSDFTLLEAGQPQKIRFFDTHQGITTSHYTPMQLPPQVYTNIPDYDPNAPKNIVLLDLLNTEFLDQSYTRQQMLKFLANLPGGQPMAVLTLTTSVNMVQGFTGSSDKLVEIAKKLQMANSVLLTSRASAEADSDALDALRMSGGPGASDLADRVAKALAYSEDSRGCERLVRTTAAFEAIARLLSGYPGRKNLMWISGDFPLSIQPNFITDSNNLHASNLDCLESPYQLPKISALLASARVAVYPIDVRGVETDMAGPSTRLGNLPNGEANLVFSHEFETEQNRSSRVFGNGGAASFFARSGERDIMNDLAEQTGGKAFYGSNDITGAMRKTMDLASSYYSLSYEPKDTNWNGRYRKIRVKVATPNRAHLWYRRGYYALAEAAPVHDSQPQEFAEAMSPSVPTSTQLLFKVRVLPPDREHPTVRIDYAVDAEGLNYSNRANGQRVFVDFAAVAWSTKIKVAAKVSNTLDTTISPQRMQEYQRTGLPAKQELNLIPGNYWLRVGVIDRTTGKIGTLDVSLRIPKS